MAIRLAKERGEWAELRFMTRATELRLRVAKPWGDSAPYDLATEYRARFSRVQVKCTFFHRGNSYKCHLDSNGVPYSPRDIDFIAAYVIPTDTWYILPIRATHGRAGAPAAKRRKNAAHGASRGWERKMSPKPRRGERDDTHTPMPPNPCAQSQMYRGSYST